MRQPITDTTDFAKYHDLVEKIDKEHNKRGTNFYKLSLVSLFVQCTLQAMFMGMAALVIWILTIAVHAGIVLLAMHARPQQPRMIIWFFAAMVAGSVLFCYNIIAAVGGIILYLPAMKASKKAVWLSKQPGYPYFNERFMLQQDHYMEEYEGEHSFSDRLGDEMFAVEEGSEEMQPHKKLRDADALLMQEISNPDIPES